MASKDCDLSSKEKSCIYGANSNGLKQQFTNLNLNQKVCSTECVHVNNISTSSKQKFETAKVRETEKDEKSQNFSKILEPLNVNDSHKNAGRLAKYTTRGNKSSNDSTLSLHITAYENSVNALHAANDSRHSQKETKKVQKFKKNLQASAVQNPFEIPRQQKEDQREPEIAQFATSQKLLNPNDPKYSPQPACYQLSEYFIYFAAKKLSPDGFIPILQIVGARETAHGIRLRIFDGYFYSNAFYVFDPDVVAEIKNLKVSSPVIAVLAYEMEEVNGVITFIIHALQRINEYADVSKGVFNHLLEKATDYDEFMSDKHLGEGMDSNIDPVAKRSKIESSSTHSQNNESVAVAATDSTSVASESSSNTKPLLSVMPLKLLTQYVEKWRILGYCTLKSVRIVTTATKGEMKILEFNVTEESGVSIKITAWNQEADNIAAEIHENQMYYVSGDQSSVIRKNPKYNFTECDYEIKWNAKCSIIPCQNPTFPLPMFSIKRNMLCDLKASEEIFDVLVVIDKIGEKMNVTVKSTNKEISKRDITLVDESGCCIVLTLWAEHVDDEAFSKSGAVVAIKSVKIKEFNGNLYLGLVNDSKVKTNPTVTGLDVLKKWYSEIRPKVELKALSFGSDASNVSFGVMYRSLSAIKNSQMLESLKNGVFVYVKCEILSVKRDDPYYRACKRCHKKVTDTEMGYICEKCYIENPPTNLRYKLVLELSDGFENQYVTLFDEPATKLLGYDANQLDRIRMYDEKSYREVFDPLMYQSLAFKMKVKEEMFEDKIRKNFTVVQVKPIPNPDYETCLEEALTKLETL